MSACSEVVVIKEGGVLDAGPVDAVRARCAFLDSLMQGTAADGAGHDGEGGEGRTSAAAADAAAGPPPADAQPPAGHGAFSAPSARTLVEVEHREKGQVSAKVVGAYFDAAGGPLACGLIACLFAAKTGTDFTANWWLSQWSAASAARDGEVPAGPISGRHPTGWWLSGYLLVQLCGVGLTLASQLSLALGGLRASRELARRLSSALLCAPLSFFHANPLGRLLNVATKDQRDVDQVRNAARRALLRTCA